MKKILPLSFLLYVSYSKADIPPYDNAPLNIAANFNYLPWVIGFLGALAVLIFMYTYKKETKG